MPLYLVCLDLALLFLFSLVLLVKSITCSRQMSMYGLDKHTALQPSIYRPD